MNIGEMIVWWITRGLIGWGIWTVVTLVGLVWWALKDEESLKALDKLLEESPDKSRLYSVLMTFVDIICWPIMLVRSSIELHKNYNRLIDIRDHLYLENQEDW